MFDSLDERIKQDEGMSTKKRTIEILMIIVISFALFGGLYLAMKLTEG
jgi:hypothetical protein